MTGKSQLESCKGSARSEERCCFAGQSAVTWLARHQLRKLVVGCAASTSAALSTSRSPVAFASPVPPNTGMHAIL